MGWTPQADLSLVRLVGRYLGGPIRNGNGRDLGCDLELVYIEVALFIGGKGTWYPEIG